MISRRPKRITRTLEDPARRVMINRHARLRRLLVQSNCISVEPLETEMGRKRTINQSTRNKDYSCVKGLPVLRHDRRRKLRRRAPPDLGSIGELPAPASRPSLSGSTTSPSAASVAAPAC
jgi:indolepyruvate ferredoxin oxidoreductase